VDWRGSFAMTAMMRDGGVGVKAEGVPPQDGFGARSD